MKAIILVSIFSLASCGSAPTKNPDTEIAVETMKPTPPVSSRSAFKTRSELPWVVSLVRAGNCVLANESFLAEVAAFAPYTHTQATGEKIAASLRTGEATITLYRTKNPWSKAIATTFAGDRESIYLNARANPRGMRSMVNTIVHELLHLEGYSHGDNSPVGKHNAVNYKVGSIAEKYVDGACP